MVQRIVCTSNCSGINFPPEHLKMPRSPGCRWRQKNWFCVKQRSPDTPASFAALVYPFKGGVGVWAPRFRLPSMVPRRIWKHQTPLWLWSIGNGEQMTGFILEFLQKPHTVQTKTVSDNKPMLTLDRNRNSVIGKKYFTTWRQRCYLSGVVALQSTCSRYTSSTKPSPLHCLIDSRTRLRK